MGGKPMSDDTHFFLREPWVYDKMASRPVRDDAADGFDTRSLHAGFDPMQNQNDFRSFVPPLVQSITFPYETFDKVPCPVYGRTRTPTNTVLEAGRGHVRGPFVLSGVAFADVPVRVSERFPEMMIGARTLQNYRIVIDQQSQLLAICP